MAWVDPALTIAAGGLTGATDDNISPTIWNRLAGNLTQLGGADGYAGQAFTGRNGIRNEFYWPPCVAVGSNLDTLLLWWRRIAGGTITYSTATTEGVATTYGEDLVKVVAASASDGGKSTWTYANEKRVKSGRAFSALVAVYVVTAARTATVKLITSASTTVSGTVSAIGSWQLVALENLTLDGTTMDLQVTLDGAGTVLMIPLGASIGPKAFALPPRPLRFVDKRVAALSAVDPGGAAYTDLDLTSVTSALTMLAQIGVQYSNSTASRALFLRRNGDTAGLVVETAIATNPSLTISARARTLVALDDGQIFEYQTDGPAGDAETLYLTVEGYWEWA